MRKLKRTSVDIYTASGKIPAKQHFEIVAGILTIEVDWPEGFGSEAFRSVHQSLTGSRAIDCGFAAKGASFDIFADTQAYTFGPTDNALAFFAFRLLSKLQALATVPAVDWMAYANQLSRLYAKPRGRLLDLLAQELRCSSVTDLVPICALLTPRLAQEPAAQSPRAVLHRDG